jgi:hypothetical protein
MTPAVADAGPPWISVEWRMEASTTHTSCGVIENAVAFETVVDSQTYALAYKGNVDDRGIRLSGTLTTAGRSGKLEASQWGVITPVDGTEASITTTVPSPRGYRGPDGRRQKTLTWTVQARAVSSAECMGPLMSGGLIGAKGTQTLAPSEPSSVEEETDSPSLE